MNHMNHTIKLNTAIKEFTEYVITFHGMDSELYPMNASDEQIGRVCKAYRETCRSRHTEIQWGYGDTIDRERVRKLLFALGYHWKAENTIL